MLLFEKNGCFKCLHKKDGLIHDFLTYAKNSPSSGAFPFSNKLKVVSQSDHKILVQSNSIRFSLLKGYDSLEVEYREKFNDISYRIRFRRWALFYFFIFFTVSVIIGFLLLSHLFSLYLFPDFAYPSKFEIYVYIIPMIIFWGMIWPFLLINKHKKELKENFIDLLMDLSLTGKQKVYTKKDRYALRNKIAWGVLFLCSVFIGYLLHRRMRLGPARFGYSFASTQPDWKMQRGNFSLPGVDITTKTINDFSGFLGENRDNAVNNIRLNPDWSNYPPKLIWRKPIGAGWSAFSVVNGYAVTMEQRGPEEEVTCYGVDTGKQYWSIGWDSRFFLFGDGPRSTPAIYKGKVFALGAFGELICIDGNSGSEIWRKNILDYLGITPEQEHKEILFGRSNSPLVVNEMVIIPGGGYGGKYSSLLAFNVSNGNFCWSGGKDQISYSSPALAEVFGKKQILVVNENSVNGYDLQTGKTLWSYPWPGDNGVDANVSQAVAVGNNRILVSKGYSAGAVLLEIYRDKRNNDFKVKEIWRNRNVMRTKFSNVVIWENHIYGLSDTRLECVDLKTGKRCWKKGRYGYGQILRVGDMLLVQSEYGKIYLLDLSYDTPSQVLGSFQAIEGKTWNNIALYGRFLLLRNSTEAACYELPILLE